MSRHLVRLGRIGVLYLAMAVPGPQNCWVVQAVRRYGKKQGLTLFPSQLHLREQDRWPPTVAKPAGPSLTDLAFSDHGGYEPVKSLADEMIV